MPDTALVLDGVLGGRGHLLVGESSRVPANEPLEDFKLSQGLDAVSHLWFPFRWTPLI